MVRTGNIDSDGTITPLPTDFNISGQAQGDVLYFDGTNWVRLAPGTAGQRLETQGAGSNPTWENEQSNLTGDVTSVGLATTVVTNANLTGDVTSVGNATTIANGVVDVANLSNGTDGELITWNSSGVASTVATGTSGDVLTSNGAGSEPTFQAAAGGGGIPSNIQVFTSNGTWIKPAEVSQVLVEVWGSGGNGSAGGTSGIGGGGAGGGYSRGLIAVSGNVTVTVATAAASTSSFAGDSTIQATGGANAVASNQSVGGIGSGGTVNLQGGEGGAASASGGPGNSGGGSPMGGAGGGGGSEGTAPDKAGNNGTRPGGGGGGGGNTSGAAGLHADGLVIVSY